MTRWKSQVRNPVEPESDAQSSDTASLMRSAGAAGAISENRLFPTPSGRTESMNSGISAECVRHLSHGTRGSAPLTHFAGARADE
jgi:hypothetical protein